MKIIARFILRMLPLSISGLIKEKYKQRVRDKSTPNWSRSLYIPNTKNPIKIGFVGAGNYAKHHLTSLSQMKNVNLKYLLSDTGKNALGLKQTFGFQETFTEIDVFLEREVDAYVVISSSDTIYSVSKKLFKNGKPILLEKPPGFSSKETWELHEISKKNNTYGMVALNRRYYSDFQHGLALLADYGPIRGAVLEVPESITKAKQEQELRELEYENYFYT